MTLLTKQSVAAVTRAERQNLPRFREVRDVFVLCVAGPRGILLIGGKGYTHRVQAFHELAVRAQYVEYLHADAGHDVHVRDDVRRVADLHTDFGNG